MKAGRFLLKGVFSGFLLLLFCIQPGWAATLYVHPTQGPYPEINLAINAATVGDEIVVAPGDYQPVNFNKRMIHVRSEKGPEVTKILGSGTGDAVYFSPLSAGSSISGFHISGASYGIKIDCSSAGDVCSDLSITNNIVFGAGLNAIYLVSTTTSCAAVYSQITNILIANNVLASSVKSGLLLNAAGKKGAWNCTASSGNIEFVRIENNIFVDNKEYGIVKVAGVYSWFANNTFFNNIFKNILGDVNGVTVLDTNGNMFATDPRFVAGSYRISQLTDPLPSPAIDAGMAGSQYFDPDGTRNDIGAYGGPGAAYFWPYPKGGPIVTALSVTPSSVPQGGTITIRATGEIR